MTDEKDPTVGTPEAEGVDDADEALGAEPELSDDGQSSGPKVSTEELIALRQKAERLNALERRHGTDFEQRLGQPPAAHEAEPEEDDSDEDDPDLAATIAFAKKGDPVAKLALRQIRATQRKEMLRDQLDEIDDKNERAEVRAHFLKNQHRLGDIKAASAEVRAAKLEARTRELEAKLAGRTEGPKVNTAAKTTLKESPGSVPKPKAMTYAQFMAENRKLGMIEGLKRQKDLEEGRIVLTDAE